MVDFKPQTENHVSQRDVLLQTRPNIAQLDAFPAKLAELKMRKQSILLVIELFHLMHPHLAQLGCLCGVIVCLDFYIFALELVPQFLVDAVLKFESWLHVIL